MNDQINKSDTSSAADATDATETGTDTANADAVDLSVLATIDTKALEATIADREDKTPEDRRPAVERPETVIPTQEIVGTAEEGQKAVTYHVFHSRTERCRMIHPDGTAINFSQFRHVTSTSKIIKYLNKEIKEGHPHIYINEDEKTIDGAKLADPMEMLRQKIIREHEQRKLQDENYAKAHTPHAGESETRDTHALYKTGIGTTAHIFDDLVRKS
jgi:hypothetical protein